MPGVRTTVSVRVVEAVASATGRDELTLPPLYDAVDPDALDTLTEGTRDVEISFVYAGYEVTVGSDGEVTLEERSDVHVTGEVQTAD
ncbi:MAG: HalOD1 output domain-containing protein [Haloferacaceae archaeon]